MMTSSRLTYHDGLPGHWNDDSLPSPLSKGRLALLLALGLGGCVAAVEMVLRLYPLA
jgi:hypothetical protein